MNLSLFKMRKVVLALTMLFIRKPPISGHTEISVAWPLPMGSVSFAEFRHYRFTVSDSDAAENIGWHDEFEWTQESQLMKRLPENERLELSPCLTSTCEPPFFPVSQNSNLSPAWAFLIFSIEILDDSATVASSSTLFYLGLRSPTVNATTQKPKPPASFASQSDPYSVLPCGAARTDVPFANDTGSDVDWSRYDPARDGWVAAEETWTVRADEWRRWYPPALSAASLHIFRRNTAPDWDPTLHPPPLPPPLAAAARPEARIAASADKAAAAAAGRLVAEGVEERAGRGRRLGEPEFGFPAAVMNLRRRPDRRRHAARLLADLGFRNVSFPATTAGVDLDLDRLVAEGRVTAQGLESMARKHGAASVRAYAANALDYTAALRELSRAPDDYGLMGIFEDDLASATDATATRRAVAAALRQLPPSADMLYLEACFERCAELSYSAVRPALARARHPLCCAAIVFTRKGARKATELCSPVFDGMDNMLATLVEQENLEAYIALPGLLFQDGYWGSDAMRKTNNDFQIQRHGRRSHVLIGSICDEYPSIAALAAATYRGAPTPTAALRAEGAFARVVGAARLVPPRLLEAAASVYPGLATVTAPELAARAWKSARCGPRGGHCRFALLLHPWQLCSLCAIPIDGHAVLLVPKDQDEDSPSLHQHNGEKITANYRKAQSKHEATRNTEDDQHHHGGVAFGQVSPHREESVDSGEAVTAVEVGSWEHEDATAVLWLERNGAGGSCWGREVCAVIVAMMDEDGKEVERHAAAILLGPWDAD